MKMRIIVLVTIYSAFAMPGGFGSLSSPQAALPAQQIPADPNASLLWEQAIEAKGGRAKLHAVSNILESYSDKSSVGLYVFPSRLWLWTDDRPTPLGVYVRMVNFDQDLHYSIDDDSTTPVNRGKRNASEGPIVNIQLAYLLESKWVKPIPVKVYSGHIGLKPVDIIRTNVKGSRYDFHLDAQSHLPLKVVFPWPQDCEGTNYGRGSLYTTFADYADVNGIQMPRKVGHLAKPEIQQMSSLTSTMIREYLSVHRV